MGSFDCQVWGEGGVIWTRNLRGGGVWTPPPTPRLILDPFPLSTLLTPVHVIEIGYLENDTIQLPPNRSVSILLTPVHVMIWEECVLSSCRSVSTLLTPVHVIEIGDIKYCSDIQYLDIR